MTEFHKFGRDEPWPKGKIIGECGCKADGGAAGNDIAGTSFGLLPFLGGGQTHKPNADNPFFDPDTFWSLHPGGCNFLFGDGSVHFLTSGILPATYQAMMTIAGGEPSTNW